MIKGTVTRHTISAYRATACENPNRMNLTKTSPSLNANHIGRSRRERLLSLLEATTLSLTIGKATALANIKLYTPATPRKAQPPQNDDTNHTHETTRAALLPKEPKNLGGTWQQPPKQARSPQQKSGPGPYGGTGERSQAPLYSQWDSNPHGPTASRF